MPLLASLPTDRLFPINEKSLNETTGKEYFKHRKLVAAYKSLRRNLPYLFTYKNYPELDMPNTTNSLDPKFKSEMQSLRFKFWD